MNVVQIVPIEYIAQIWSEVQSYLEESNATGTGDVTPDQLKQLLMQGKQTLLVSLNDKEINGAMAVEVYNSPNERIAHITALGGRGVVDQETFAQVEKWARSQGATRIRAWAQEAQARLYQHRAGFSTMRYVVEKSL